MKDLIAKEFLYLFLALMTAIPVAFLFIYLVGFIPEPAPPTKDEQVLEMALLLFGGLIGFIGVYLMRLTVWAVKQLAGSNT
ncbi:MAG: hypothetical protein AAF149_03015 [Bacteroidota bacterium]